jgi:excisionase family DNA binding protein
VTTVAKKETVKKPFDPMQYIESAFLDREPEPLDQLPNLGDYLNGKTPTPKKAKYRKTQMSAPRPRPVNNPSATKLDHKMENVWNHLPKVVSFLSSDFDDAVTANYYRGEFKETRDEFIQRLLDPELSLEDASRLLGVCPATVRRYTNREWLSFHRTKGGQRRFRLSDIVNFVEIHGRFPRE